jgi:hypothetical protein
MFILRSLCEKRIIQTHLISTQTLTEIISPLDERVSPLQNFYGHLNEKYKFFKAVNVLN